MIELEIEKKIVEAIAAVVPEGVAVRGTWITAGEGELQGEDKAKDDAIVIVAVGQRKFETFGLCKAEFGVSMAFAVRGERDPRGELTLEAYQKVIDKLTEWHFDANGAMREALSVEGFTADGLRLEGGDGPQKEGEAYKAVTFGFTLVGTVWH